MGLGVGLGTFAWRSFSGTVDSNIHSPDFDDHHARLPKLVLIGSGWATHSILQGIDPRLCDVMVISDRNHFVYTPMLPASCVGSVELRSIVSPVREILSHTSTRAWWFWKHDSESVPSRTFYEATVEDIDPAEKKIFCRSKHTGSLSTVNYDVAVICVGSDNNDSGLTGVSNHCHFLKNADDARAIRRTINNTLERASETQVTMDERRRLLHFCIVGGGPAGTEFAAELHDFLKDDAPRLYPKDLLDLVQVCVIQSGTVILNSYDRAIAEYATNKFQRDGIRLILNSRVVGVDENFLTVVDKESHIKREIPFGLCVWTTGVAMRPMIRRITDRIGHEIQSNKHALIVNRHLGVVGDDQRSLYAAGDCSTIQMPGIRTHAEQLFDEADLDGDGQIQLYEWLHFVRKSRDRYPQLEEYAAHGEALLKGGKKSMNQDQFLEWLDFVDANTTSLPATAQVAHQQGKYLSKLLNRRLACWPRAFHDTDDSVMP